MEFVVKIVKPLKTLKIAKKIIFLLLSFASFSALTSEVNIKGILLRDYESKFETTATKKFLRGIYEKWVIAARVDQFQTDLIKLCEDFLEQTKGFLALEGKK